MSEDQRALASFVFVIGLALVLALSEGAGW